MIAHFVRKCVNYQLLFKWSQSCEAGIKTLITLFWILLYYYYNYFFCILADESNFLLFNFLIQI